MVVFPPALLTFVGFSAKDATLILRLEMLDSCHPAIIINFSRDRKVLLLMNPMIIGWLVLGCPRLFKLKEQRHFHQMMKILCLRL